MKKNNRVVLQISAVPLILSALVFIFFNVLFDGNPKTGSEESSSPLFGKALTQAKVDLET